MVCFKETLIRRDDLTPVDLNDDENRAIYMRVRRDGWASKFGYFWQLEISVACGYPATPAALSAVDFPGFYQSSFDPSFMEIPILVKRWKFDEAKQKFRKRKPEEVVECPFTTVWGEAQDKSNCARISASRDSTESSDRWAFQLYREAKTVNAWLRSKGALVVETVDDHNNLDDTLKSRVSDVVGGGRFAEKVVRLLRDGPTKRGAGLLAQSRRRRSPPRPRNPPPPIPRQRAPPLPEI